jgi:hypothetical protein
MAFTIRKIERVKSGEGTNFSTKIAFLRKGAF